jgi:hypothetical protein
MKAAAAQHCTPMLIRCNRLRLEMLPAVQFDNQSLFNAGKVCKVPGHGMLSSKLEASELAIAQCSPDFGLSVGRGFS